MTPTHTYPTALSPSHLERLAGFVFEEDVPLDEEAFFRHMKKREKSNASSVSWDELLIELQYFAGQSCLSLVQTKMKESKVLGYGPSLRYSSAKETYYFTDIHFGKVIPPKLEESEYLKNAKELEFGEVILTKGEQYKRVWPFKIEGCNVCPERSISRSYPMVGMNDSDFFGSMAFVWDSAIASDCDEHSSQSTNRIILVGDSILRRLFKIDDDVKIEHTPEFYEQTLAKAIKYYESIEDPQSRQREDRISVRDTLVAGVLNPAMILKNWGNGYCPNPTVIQIERLMYVGGRKKEDVPSTALFTNPLAEKVLEYVRTHKAKDK